MLEQFKLIRYSNVTSTDNTVSAVQVKRDLDVALNQKGKILKTEVELEAPDEMHFSY